MKAFLKNFWYTQYTSCVLTVRRQRERVAVLDRDREKQASWSERCFKQSLERTFRST